MNDGDHKDATSFDPYNPASANPAPASLNAANSNLIGPTPSDPAIYDQYGNARFEPVETVGRAPYILLGLLVAVGVIGGLVYFNHSPRDPEIATLSTGAPTGAYMQKVPPTPLAHSTAPAH